MFRVQVLEKKMKKKQRDLQSKQCAWRCDEKKCKKNHNEKNEREIK
jgi:hypothetical protein